MSWLGRRPIARWRRRARVLADLDHLTDEQLAAWPREHGTRFSGMERPVTGPVIRVIRREPVPAPQRQQQAVPDREAGE